MRLHLSPLVCCQILLAFLFVTKSASSDPPPVKDNFPYAEQCKEPDSAGSLSESVVSEDNSCRYKLSGFEIVPPNGTWLIEREHISGSDLLSLLSRDQFLRSKCDHFKRVESCVYTYYQNRQRCMDLSEIFVKPAIGLYKTMCSPNFEATVKSVLDNVGDTCVDAIYQNIFKLEASAINKQPCQDTVEQAAMEAWNNGKRFDYLKTNFGLDIINNCILSPVEQICGQRAKEQMKRLTDLFFSTLNF